MGQGNLVAAVADSSCFSALFKATVELSYLIRLRLLVRGAGKDTSWGDTGRETAIMRIVKFVGRLFSNVCKRL